jgi:hypothetical protein
VALIDFLPELLGVVACVVVFPSSKFVVFCNRVCAFLLRFIANCQRKPIPREWGVELLW